MTNIDRVDVPAQILAITLSSNLNVTVGQDRLDLPAIHPFSSVYGKNAGGNQDYLCRESRSANQSKNPLVLNSSDLHRR